MRPAKETSEVARNFPVNTSQGSSYRLEVGMATRVKALSKLNVSRQLVSLFGSGMCNAKGLTLVQECRWVPLALFSF